MPGWVPHRLILVKATPYAAAQHSCHAAVHPRVAMEKLK
jgi:hypothetical protein